MVMIGILQQEVTYKFIFVCQMWHFVKLIDIMKDLLLWMYKEIQIVQLTQPSF